MEFWSNGEYKIVHRRDDRLEQMEPLSMPIMFIEPSFSQHSATPILQYSTSRPRRNRHNLFNINPDKTG
jgi:hypothetical protein